MLSRVSIDIDEENNPIILLAVDINSEDIRDKIANRFTKEFEKGSIHCLVEHIGLDRQHRLVWEIKPISVEEKILATKDLIKFVHQLKSDQELNKLSVEELIKKYL